MSLKILEITFPKLLEIRWMNSYIIRDIWTRAESRTVTWALSRDLSRSVSQSVSRVVSQSVSRTVTPAVSRSVRMTNVYTSQTMSSTMDLYTLVI